ncbi:hypothetical protein Celaphus_00009779 [Cervus elaphus hippelaphus]|uniref:Uncharacterized protein n=1 Tax=Cervus elaphus hippelaphus TaxID=46360 RepID=A0A212BZC8_CEREH|nr:hypothetical protein Celaphus_00009779 [Cervus elaphus hippelaphus]
MFLLPEGTASETGTLQSTEPGLPGLQGEQGPKGHIGLKGMKGDLCLLRVMVHRASPVKRGYQDFLVKKATLVQLAPQELGYQGLLDLVDFLEIKE